MNEQNEARFLEQVDAEKEIQRMKQLKERHDKRMGWFFRKFLGEPPYHVWKWKLLTTLAGHYVDKGICEVCGAITYNTNPHIPFGNPAGY